MKRKPRQKTPDPVAVVAAQEAERQRKSRLRAFLWMRVENAIEGAAIIAGEHALTEEAFVNCARQAYRNSVIALQMCRRRETQQLNEFQVATTKQPEEKKQ
jgi:hypothetical protein